jgi:hypothetical protein
VPPSLARSFPLYRSPEESRVQGSCATTTAHGLSPVVLCRGLHVRGLFLLANPFEDFLNSDRASCSCLCFVLLVACGTHAVFMSATAFDQNIDSWDVFSVTDTGRSKCPLLSRVLTPLASIPGRSACARIVCHDDGQRQVTIVRHRRARRGARPAHSARREACFRPV